MRTNYFFRKAMVMVMAMVVAGLLSSCSVKPHSSRAGQSRNKAIIDLQKSESVKAEESKADKRTKVAAVPRKNNKRNSSGSRKVEPVKEQAVAKVETESAINMDEKAKPPASAKVVQISEQINPSRSAEYRLGYGDVIEIKFFNTPEYNETVAIRPDGFISLQRLSELYVTGKTTSEINREITQAYSEVLQNPEVTVFVRQFGGQQCYVMGEVEKPGIITVTKGMTLMRAIAAAGGPKKTAKMSSIILIRSEDLKKAEASRLDLSFGHLSKHMETDLAISSYDVIYVPKTFIADVGAFMSQIYDIVLPPFDAWARYEFWYKN
jgi:polysaccharide biosynthesis/export protein